MNIQELLQRERIAVKELRQQLTGIIETEVQKWLGRLDDLELRIEKTKLTGGQPTVTEPVKSNGTPNVIYEDAIHPKEITGNLQGKPDRE